MSLDINLMRRVIDELEDDRKDLLHANTITEPETGVPLGTHTIDSLVCKHVRNLAAWLETRHDDTRKVVREIAGLDHLAGSKIDQLEKELRGKFRG